MSTGNPNIDPYHGLHLVKNGEQSIEQQKKIELNWYRAIRGKKSFLSGKSKIERVAFSPIFLKIMDMVDSRCAPVNTKKGSDKIKEITGFDMQELNNKRFQLEQEYRDKTEAPGLVNG